jgi:hypothetical protein
MKKTITVLALTVLFITGSAYMAITYTGGPPAGHTNAPGESNCTGCHSGSLVTSGTNWSNMSLSSSVSLGAFQPNTNYTLNLTFADPLRSKYGFQMVALPASANSNSTSIGSFGSSNNDVQTQTSSGRSYAEHTSSGTSVSNNTKTWNVNWQTPVSFNGSVVFHVVVNSTNANTSSAGDVIYYKTFTATVLPVSWSDITSTREDGMAKLKWSTATEINNSHFIIERSHDDSNWEIISEVKGAGNSNKMTHYEFNDNQAPKTALIYRIRQVDFDGKESYSPKVWLQGENDLDIPRIVYTGNYITVLTSSLSKSHKVRILGLNGSIVFDKEIVSNEQVPLATFDKGIYVAEINTDGIVQFKKIMVN